MELTSRIQMLRGVISRLKDELYYEKGRLQQEIDKTLEVAGYNIDAADLRRAQFYNNWREKALSRKKKNYPAGVTNKAVQPQDSNMNCDWRNSNAYQDDENENTWLDVYGPKKTYDYQQGAASNEYRDWGDAYPVQKSQSYRHQELEEEDEEDLAQECDWRRPHTAPAGPYASPGSLQQRRRHAAAVYIQRLNEVERMCGQELMRIQHSILCLAPLKALTNHWPCSSLEPHNVQSVPLWTSVSETVRSVSSTNFTYTDPDRPIVIKFR